MGTEQEKKAIILETNFIYQNAKTLEKVVEELSKHGTIYVTQVTVDERIAQAIRDMRAQYHELEQKNNSDYHRFANIKFTMTIEAAEQYYRSGIQSNYEKVFPGRIIPFSTDEKTFKVVLQRANDKKAPFVDAENASDKGFKDTLIWLSILGYFKEKGEDKVVLITDDRIFTKHIADLKKEFAETTGKKIEVKPNSFYKELIVEEKPQIAKKPEPLPDFTALRFELESVFNSITLTPEDDSYGGYELVSAFNIYDYVDEKYAESFFSQLRGNIDAHVFERMVAPSEFFGINETEVDNNADISIENFEKALRLYEKIVKDYAQYTKPFFTAFAQAVNNNRTDKPQVLVPITNDDIPF